MKSNIYNLKREQVIQYHTQNYTAKNFNLVAVGNLEHNQLVAHCEKYFGNVPEHAPDYTPSPSDIAPKMMKILPIGNEGYSFYDQNQKTSILPNHNFGMYPSYDAEGVFAEQFNWESLLKLDSAVAPTGTFSGADTKPIFQPNLMLIEGKNQTSTKIGIYYDAPDWFDPEMYVFLLLQRMIGNREVSLTTGDYDHFSFLTGESSTSQMTITDFLKQFPFVQEFKSGYSPYRNAGFFGFFLKGSPDKTFDMIMLLQAWLEQFIINLSNLSNLLKRRLR